MYKLMYEMTDCNNGSFQYDPITDSVSIWTTMDVVTLKIVPMNNLERLGALSLVCVALNEYEDDELVPPTTLDALNNATTMMGNKIAFFPPKTMSTHVGDTLQLMYVFKLEGLDDIYGVAINPQNNSHSVVKFRL